MSNSRNSSIDHPISGLLGRILRGCRRDEFWWGSVVGHPIAIRSLGPEDAEVFERLRPGLLDGPTDASRVWAFLATRVNQLVVALDQGEVVGFASGTVVMRPDAATEFYLSDLRAHPDYRRRGIARKLLVRITDLAAERGCETIWATADGDNDAARAVAKSIAAESEGDVVRWSWTFI